MGPASSAATRAEIDVYGLRASVRGDWPEVVEELGADFSWFDTNRDQAQADVEIVIERRPPDYDSFGGALATFVTPRNVVYQVGNRTVVDYFGRAVSVLDRTAGRLTVQGEDRHLVHEAAYHFLISRFGEHLDARRLPRLHALGLSTGEGAVALILPSGGGKSTMALRALRDDRVRLLSEDSPLLDLRGRLHPFPLRIGVNPTDAELLPSDHVRRLERMEFHPKLLLDVPAFRERIESRPRALRHLVLGRRSLGRGASLEPVPRRAAIGPLLREAVVGVGLYQGMEFVLQRGMWDVLGNMGTAVTRSACCAAALGRASVWRLEMGRDHERNWSALEPLMEG